MFGEHCVCSIHVAVVYLHDARCEILAVALATFLLSYGVCQLSKNDAGYIGTIGTLKELDTTLKW